MNVQHVQLRTPHFEMEWRRGRIHPDGTTEVWSSAALEADLGVSERVVGVSQGSDAEVVLLLLQKTRQSQQDEMDQFLIRMMLGCCISPCSFTPRSAPAATLRSLSQAPITNRSLCQTT